MSPEADRPDVATRLVDAIKSAMGLSNPAEGQAANAPPLWLRAVFLAGAVAMLALWGWSLVPAIQNWNNPREDGFSMVPAVYGTITMLPLGLIMLAGGIAANATNARRARVALVIAIALLAMMAALEILRRMSNATGGL